MNLRPQQVLLAADDREDAPFCVRARLKPLSNKPTEKRATFVEGLDLLPWDERPPHLRFPHNDEREGNTMLTFREPPEEIV
jgi:hypothetical protein